MAFLNAVDELYPEVLEELARLHERRKRSRPHLHDSEVARILGAHHLSTVWIKAAARTTLQAWATNDARRTREWHVEPHLICGVGRNEMGSEPLEWNVLWETEHDLRERFEAFVRRRKEETFDADFVQVSAGRGRPARASLVDRARMLALRVVGGRTYKAIADKLAGGIGGRRVDLTESAVQQHVYKLANVIELPLPPQRGRRSTAECHGSADECAADLGGSVGLSQREVQQLARLAGPRRPFTESELHRWVAALGEGLRLPPPTRRRRRSTTRKAP